MKQGWFIHKYQHGRWVTCHYIRESFDVLDRLCRRLADIHGKHGWSYELSGSANDPRATAERDAPLMIA